MKQTIHSIRFALKEMMQWHNLKYILISGLITILLWGILGAFLWDPLNAFTVKILDFIPFSMVRSNGAWMLSAFVWFQMILITFALFWIFAGHLLFHDTSKTFYSKRTLIILGVIGLFWSGVWFVWGDIIYQKILALLTELPFQTVREGVADLFALYLIYNAMIVSMLFMVSLFSEPLIKHINALHFNAKDVEAKKIFSSMGYTLKDTLIFTVVTVVLFPLMFIPFLNIIIQIAFWAWLTKDTIAYDAASLALKSPDKSIVKHNSPQLWIITVVAILFNFFPLLHIFAPFFGEIAMFHYFKNRAD